MVRLIFLILYKSFVVTSVMRDDGDIVIRVRGGKIVDEDIS